MIYILNKYFLIPSAIVAVVFGVGFTDLNGGVVKIPEESEKSVEVEKVYRSPFSLPKGVHSGFEGFEKGEVAKSVIGIFRSGKNVRAVINGKWAAEGETIGEENVFEIRKDAVVMIGEAGDKRELLLPWTETDLKVTKKVKPPKIKEEM